MNTVFLKKLLSVVFQSVWETDSSLFSNYGIIHTNSVALPSLQVGGVERKMGRGAEWKFRISYFHL